MGFWDYAKWGISPAWGAIDALNANDEKNNASDNQARTGLLGSGAAGMGLGQQAQGYYGNYNQGLQNTLSGMGQTQDYFRNQMNGQNSVSAMQLQQGLGQNLAQQHSMAASAAPQNSAMAARQAASNSAKLGYGMSGQAAMAGLQERNQAAQLLNQSQQGMGQLQGSAMANAGQTANGAYGTAAQSYGGILGKPPDQPWWQKAAAGAAAAAPLAFSDARLKKDISTADDASKATLGRLNAYSFDYKDQAHGKGRQLGVMAQELETAGLGHTIVERPEGKAVDTAKLSLANTAMLSSLHKRLSKLEK